MKTALAILLLLGFTAVADAQTTTTPVRVTGTVQWIGGLGMALALDTGSSVPVDLTQVEQDNYRGLTAGDRVVVTGMLAPRRNRLIATAIAPAP